MIEDLKRKMCGSYIRGVWRGSYGHGAAAGISADADMYHVKTMEDAMTEVEEGRADYMGCLLKTHSRWGSKRQL